MMNFNDYKDNLITNDTFAPGLDRIYSTLDIIYKDQEPASYKLFNINQPLFNRHSLEGFSVYKNTTSNLSHNHIVSLGFSELYGNVQSFMREKSKLGYELTYRTTKESEDDLKDILMAIENIYKYNKSASINLTQDSFIDYRETIDSDSKFAGFLVVRDKELQSIHTEHGIVDFLQLHPIDSCTLSTLKSGKFKVTDIIDVLIEDNPLLICS
ncbi:suppressor of fused domain protein [uncultured Clostridium sp.]|uniref:suppressor of fused domain protein n=1 Tax=uncultured Clostridium sp. TaxID=59620 RepID=UPI002639BF59|nr:suppressor of fused domain protein [uncultured Clostridium sp.]